MRVVSTCAAAGALFAVLLSSPAARAQNDEPPAPAEPPAAEPASEPAAAAPSELLVPTPPEWRLRYDEARAKLLTGEFTEAAARFSDLERTAANRVDRAIAHEQATLAAEWAQKNLAFVNRHDLGESTASAKALDRRTTDELVSLYTNGVFYGIGSGIWLGVLTEPKSAAAGILPAIALTGASVGTIIALDSGRGFRYGVPQSIVSGLYIGLEEGIAWTVWHNNRKGETDLTGKEQATIIWGLSTVGAVTGGILGQTLGTTPGRSSWVGSTALWTGTLLGFTTGALVKPDDPPPAVFAAAGVGLTLGTGLGLATASAVSPSIARVRFIDLGGLGGGLLSAGLYVALANDKADGRAASGITALGGLGGLAAAWALTSSMPDDRLRTEDPKDEEKSPIARLRPMLMPSEGGGMMGVGGLLQ